MSFLLVAVVALHLLLLLLLFIATLDKAWWVLPDGETLNLWYDCLPHNQTHGWVCTSVGDTPALRGVRGLLVGSLLLSGGSLLLFLGQLRGAPPGTRFLLPGGVQLLAGLSALGGAGLYAAYGPPPPTAPRGGGGWAGSVPGLSALGGAGLYAAYGPPPAGGGGAGGSFGHCFALAWAAVPLAVGSAATYGRLRKRD